MKGIKQMVKKLEKLKDELAKNRNELRDLLLEYEDVADTADTAVQDIESAIDTLSQYL